MAEIRFKLRRRWIAAVARGLCVLLAAATLSAQTPQTAPATGGEAATDKWTITLRYGGGTPSDAGPMGHCTATFRSDGHVKIESRRRQGEAGLKNVVIYENDALSPEIVQALAQAADDALKEPSTARPRPEDGAFFDLSRSGATNSRVRHYHLLEFWHAPPAMRKFVALVNERLPLQERVPLAREPDPPQATEANSAGGKP